MRIAIFLSKFFSITVFLLLFSACSIRRDVVVNLDKNLSDMNIQVDFIGTTEKETELLKNLNYNQYWETLDLEDKYKDRETEINFPAYSGKYEYKINKDTEIWDKWWEAGCDDIFIAVDLPDLETKNIKWREAVNMKWYSWLNFWSDRNLHIKIKKSGLKIDNR